MTCLGWISDYSVPWAIDFYEVMEWKRAERARVFQNALCLTSELKFNCSSLRSPTWYAETTYRICAFAVKKLWRSSSFDNPYRFDCEGSEGSPKPSFRIIELIVLPLMFFPISNGIQKKLKAFENARLSWPMEYCGLAWCQDNVTQCKPYA